VPSEFELIARCFKRPTHHTLLGIGDDGALIAPSPGQELVVSTDLLVEGTHFFSDANPEDLGWKTLAVNVSDMAAMGAVPRWATLGIAVWPEATSSPTSTLAGLSSSDWLDAFARGFFACADEFGVDLIGGDTTRGPSGARCFSVTIMGEAPRGQALRRSGAKPGDDIWVSGMPGRAAKGLAILQGKLSLPSPQREDCFAALHRPQPRLALGLGLRTLALATSAIDVSDGLLADLGHILEQSGVSAVLDKVPDDMARDLAYLAGGDDYELIFTAPAESAAEIVALSDKLKLPLTKIGHIETGTTNTAPRVRVVDETGRDITPAHKGYDHFHD
jgi:thiamine-monophosphate kinase